MKYTVHRIPTMKHSVYRTFTVKYRLQFTEYAQRNILSEKILTMKYTVYRIPAMKYSVYGILIMNNTYSLQNTQTRSTPFQQLFCPSNATQKQQMDEEYN